MLRRLGSFSTALVTLLAGACQAPAPSPATGASPAAEAAPAAPTTAPTADAAAAAEVPTRDAPIPGSGYAYVSVARAGVFRVDAQGWSFRASSRASIRDLDEHDGTLHVLTSFGVQRSAALNDMTPVASLEPSDYERLGDPRAMAGDGRTFWVVGERGVGRYDGAWSFSTPTPELPEGFSPATDDLAIDAEGRAWLIWAGLQLSTDTGWAAVELPGGSAGPARAVVASADRRTILVHAGCTSDASPRCVLIRYRGDKLAKLDGSTVETGDRLEVDTGGCAELPSLAVSPDGDRGVIAGACGLVRFAIDDEPKRAIQNTDLDLLLRSDPLTHASGRWVGVAPTALAIDDGGRIWAGVGHGFVIVPPEGELERYPLARLTDISGTVDSLWVAGAGPTPPVLAEERRGGLAATLVRRDGAGVDTPIAGAAVELCSQAEALDESGTRCQPKAVRARATTDAEGKLAAEDLPLDAYHISVELDGRWRAVTSASSTMRAGMTGNLGKLVVEPSP